MRHILIFCFAVCLIGGVAGAQTEILVNGEFTVNTTDGWTHNKCISSAATNWDGDNVCDDGDNDIRMIRWVASSEFDYYIYQNVQMPFDGNAFISGWLLNKTEHIVCQVQVSTGASAMTPVCGGPWEEITTYGCTDGPHYMKTITSLAAGDYIMLCLRSYFAGGYPDPHYADWDHWSILASQPSGVPDRHWELY